MSKLSVHFIGQPYTDDIFHAGVKVVKLLDWDSEMDVALLRQRIDLVVFRLELGLGYRDISPDAFAARLPIQKLKGLGVIYEGVNEPVIGSVEEAQALNAWYVRFAQILQGWGERVAAFSFSTGNPPLDLVPYLAEAAATADYLALHEYVKPGPDFSQIGRYKEFLSALPPGARRQVLITETGCDVHGGGGRDGDGWLGPTWHLNSTQYLSILNQVDRIYMADDWLAGATVFQQGGGNPWQTFNVVSISKPLGGLILANGGGELPTMPNIPQPPYATDPAPADPHLSWLPRPVNDNGRALHFILDLSKNNIEGYLPYLGQLQCKWTVCYGGDENTTGYAARRILDTCGAFSILRVEAREDAMKAPPTWAGYVKSWLAQGVVPLVQIFNEPEREFTRGPKYFADQWNVRANAVYDAGGIPILQTMSQEYYNAAVDGMSDRVKNRFAFAMHNYSANHPPEYPYNKGLTPTQDDTCMLRFLAIGDWAMQKLGWVMPILGAEGGVQWGNADDKSLPPVTAQQWVDWNYTAMNWWRTGQIPGPNGSTQPLPDYVISMCPWLLYASNWYSDSWVNGLAADQKIPLLDKLEADAPYVRQFGAQPPPVVPVTAFGVSPASIHPGEAATLQWTTDNIQALYLDDVGISGNGFEVVSPSVTTTYIFRVVYQEGHEPAEQDFPVTLTVTNVPPPSGVIDPRCPWVTYTQGVKYNLVKVDFQDSKPPDFPQSQGGVSIYVRVEDRAGHGLTNEQVTLVNGGNAPQWTVYGNTVYGMSGDSNFDPNQGQTGPYSILAGDVVVRGMGLPLKQHVNYILLIVRL